MNTSRIRYCLVSLLPLVAGACASVGDLQKAEHCEVWVPGPVAGTRHATVKDGEATVVGDCKLYCILGKNKGIVFYREKGEIGSRTTQIIDIPVGSSLGHFEKSTLQMAPAIGKSAPVVIGAPPLKVTHTLLGMEQSQTFSWNERCTPAETALGITGLFAFSAWGY